MTAKGKFIAIEGLEGAGKTTAVQTLLSILNDHNIEAITTREPGGTETGEALREILKNPLYKETLDAKTELLLLYAARIQLVEEVIKPALNRGSWVISDRFELSTFAYQIGGRGLDEDFIQFLSRFSLEGFKPDLTLYMDIDPVKGMQRVSQRGNLDRFEKEPLEFFTKVREAYLTHLAGIHEVIKINARENLEEVIHNLQTNLIPFVIKNR